MTGEDKMKKVGIVFAVIGLLWIFAEVTQAAMVV
jgi:hypothetical protein